MYRYLPILLLLYSTGSLAAAYISQYMFAMEPCILCLYQRYPYFVIIALSILAIFIQGRARSLLLILCGIALLVGAGTAFFHVGVEQGYFALTDGCQVGEEIPSSLEEMTAQIMGKPNVPCDDVQFEFLGVSMAGWNFIFSLISGLTTIFIVLKNWRNNGRQES